MACSRRLQLDGNASQSFRQFGEFQNSQTFFDDIRRKTQIDARPMARDRRRNICRQITPRRRLERLKHARMPPKKLHLYVILVLDIGQDAAGECVAAARLQSENAASKIRPVFPRFWHTDYHLPIHQDDFSRMLPVLCQTNMQANFRCHSSARCHKAPRQHSVHPLPLHREALLPAPCPPFA
jgi:hypothetical protein